MLTYIMGRSEKTKVDSRCIGESNGNGNHESKGAGKTVIGG